MRAKDLSLVQCVRLMVDGSFEGTRVVQVSIGGQGFGAISILIHIKSLTNLTNLSVPSTWREERHKRDMCRKKRKVPIVQLGLWCAQREIGESYSSLRCPRSNCSPHEAERQKIYITLWGFIRVFLWGSAIFGA